MLSPAEPASRSRRRYRSLVVLALVVVPLLVGAAAPAALRALMPRTVGNAISLPEDAVALSMPAEAAAVAPRDPTELIAERLVATDLNVPPPQVANTATITDLPPAQGERALPTPNLRPGDPGWVARRLEIPALGVDVAVAVAGGAADENFPPFGGAYILRSSAQPGRGTNSYLFAHAMPELFKPLWWATIGQQVIVTMSDGQQLGYRITAVVRDIPCPDPSVYKPPNLPPALANATECDVSWTLPTASERLTLQTSQGFNRNYGEMVVIAEPDWGT